jgi:5-methylcytosine-specific restriction endonuclease McrA
MWFLNEDKIFPAVLLKLSDADFHHQFELVTSIEHSSTMKVLHLINDLDRRKSYLDLGYSSVLDYCVRKIGYSRSAAGRRIQAARCGRRYPEVFEMLRTGELKFGVAAMIEPFLTDDNKDEILGRARGASHRDVERILSEFRPPVALRDRLQYVQVPAPQPRNIDTALFERQLARIAPEVWRDRVPTEQKVFVQFLADEEFLKLFEEVRLLMGRGEEASFADVMKATLIEYRDRHSPAARQARREAKKGATSPDSRRRECKDATKSRRTSTGGRATSSRHIPDDVRDEVFVRDKGQCSFVAADGTQCQCKKGLQVDHMVPYAADGTHELSNLRLLCGAHNRLAAEQTLGKHIMQPFWRRQ